MTCSRRDSSFDFFFVSFVVFFFAAVMVNSWEALIKVSEGELKPLGARGSQGTAGSFVRIVLVACAGSAGDGSIARSSVRLLVPHRDRHAKCRARCGAWADCLFRRRRKFLPSDCLGNTSVLT